MKCKNGMLNAGILNKFIFKTQIKLAEMLLRDHSAIKMYSFNLECNQTNLDQKKKNSFVASVYYKIFLTVHKLKMTQQNWKSFLQQQLGAE